MTCDFSAGRKDFTVESVNRLDEFTFNGLIRLESHFLRRNDAEWCAVGRRWLLLNVPGVRRRHALRSGRDGHGYEETEHRQSSIQVVTENHFYLLLLIGGRVRCNVALACVNAKRLAILPICEDSDIAKRAIMSLVFRHVQDRVL